MAGEKSLLRSLTCQHDERFDTVCVAFKCLASQVEEEVLCRGCGVSFRYACVRMDLADLLMEQLANP